MSILSSLASLAGSGLASSGVPGLSGVGQGIANVAAQYQQQENMRYQADLQKQLFDYQAEYNSPANQRARLEEAGYNPALMYGTTQPTQNVPQGPSPSPVAMATTKDGDLAALSKTKNIETDTYLKQLLAGKTNAEIAGIVLENDIRSITKEHNQLLYDIAKATKDDKIFEQTLKNEKLSAEIFKIGDECRNMLAQFGLTQNQSKKVLEEIELIGKQLLAADQLYNMTEWRNGIEKKLGWIGQPAMQNIVGMGVDVLSNLVGVLKFVNNIKNPAKFLKHTYGERTVFNKDGKPMTIFEEKWNDYAP